MQAPPPISQLLLGVAGHSLSILEEVSLAHRANEALATEMLRRQEQYKNGFQRLLRLNKDLRKRLAHVQLLSVLLEDEKARLENENTKLLKEVATQRSDKKDPLDRDERWRKHIVFLQRVLRTWEGNLPIPMGAEQRFEMKRDAEMGGEEPLAAEADKLARRLETVVQSSQPVLGDDGEAMASRVKSDGWAAAPPATPEKQNPPLMPLAPGARMRRRPRCSSPDHISFHSETPDTPDTPEKKRKRTTFDTPRNIPLPDDTPRRPEPKTTSPGRPGTPEKKVRSTPLNTPSPRAPYPFSHPSSEGEREFQEWIDRHKFDLTDFDFFPDMSPVPPPVLSPVRLRGDDLTFDVTPSPNLPITPPGTEAAPAPPL
eukprot:Hpha_TRINITY_DN2591_c0_g1::TRINITY_DN2591_c0_g1_i1::g.1528::m.1528